MPSPLRILLLSCTFLVVPALHASADTEERLTRQQNIRIIHQVLTQSAGASEKVSVTDIENRLAHMSDEEIRHLAQAGERNHVANPLTVVLGSIVLLVLAVLFIVRVVD